MVSYSCQPRFVPLIEQGVKCQTIRRPRRPPSRHARPGETVSLWTGLRTSAARLIARATCTGVYPIRLTFASGEITRVVCNGLILPDLDAVAVADGFDGIADMSAFWREHHGARDFDGVLIEWAAPRGPGGRR